MYFLHKKLVFKISSGLEDVSLRTKIYFLNAQNNYLTNENTTNHKKPK